MDTAVIIIPDGLSIITSYHVIERYYIYLLKHFICSDWIIHGHLYSAVYLCLLEFRNVFYINSLSIFVTISC